MDPPRIHIFHYHKFNMSTNPLHPQLHNSNQILPLDLKKIYWKDPKGSPDSHDVYPVFPWCWSNLDHRVYRGIVTREVHLMMDPTRIHTSPLSSNQYAKQTLASRTFNPNQISFLAFKRSTGMIQKVHLLLMMFTKCSLRVTSAYTGPSPK